MSEYIERVANILGVEIGEEFRLTNALGLEEGIYKIGPVCMIKDGDITDRDVLAKIIYGAEEIVKIPWKPKYGEWFWIVKSTGRVISIKNLRSESDAGLIKFGNCFKTEADAKAHADEMKKKIMEVFKE